MDEIEEDEEEKEAEQERNRKAQMKMAHKYWATFSTGIGREVLEDLVDRYVHQNPYTQGDTNHTLFQCGQMDTVMDIMGLIDMYKENSKLSKEGE